MSIRVKSVSFEDYQNTQVTAKCANFLQSAEMAKLQESQDYIEKVEALVFERDGLRVGQTIVVYKKSFRIFKKALLLHGPLVDYHSLASLTELLEALILYLRKKNIATLSIHPYLANLIRNEKLENIEVDIASDVLEVFETLGFEHSLDSEQSLVVNQMFVKSIERFASSDEIHAAFSPSLKRDLKKFTDMNVKTEELDEHQLDQFYDILSRTAERKGFSVHPLVYFQNLKKCFGESAKFMLAYLDCPAYLAYLDKNIQSFEAKIQALKEGPQKKRTKGQIADAEDQLRSYYKRLEQFKSYQIKTDKLPLSAYLFMDYGPEIVSFYGGNDEAYLNFGGAVLLHWEMIKYAKSKSKKRFNFYGTIETEAASSGKGNFNFKRQFGGQLETLVGSFDKTLNPFYDIFKKTLGRH
ncbi:lipid II:glycine glycyltransferase FemX [Streptococcus vestibularis]|uniref:Peptidoglycan bridge formation glycyltransferase FemA/FemB family protein n=1 Tax=Streptococcus vestibularis TaxID=1343 RepID=A0AAW7QFQ8_STRVE|nr:peptidoglycan bridge formation glycyltransferase FemA/FemB family protein [Streptococcus vestibularis]MDN5268575.1 peptidoglycan bridge formation glycyltransferase FemA/FemB family protein [Streptococcus vestibularis]